jgi:hypothetical protein
MNEVCDETPFNEGDLLCLEGPNVYGGKHVHRAGLPVKRGSRWCNGYTKFGHNGSSMLRTADLKDVDHELRLELASIVRIASRIGRLQEFRKQLTGLASSP